MRSIHLLRFSARVPFRFERRIYQPPDGLDHRIDRVGHVGEIDVRDIVAGPVVVLMQTET
jgi:hypothetical protein